MMDIIKKRVQDEITTYLDKAKASATKNHRPRLMRSHFDVVNIPPQINLLEYAQKKLERQLSLEPKSVTEHEEFQKQLFNSAVSAKRSLNIRPGTPIRVTNMFRKLSQENFTNLEGALGGDLLRREFNQSDGDSVILDDEEFEKINGHVGEQGDKKLRGNCSGNSFMR
ncbi:uncharacterized protein LOC111691827 [Anoplophora glabripennis]|uniref:uncharacterized protein LOC111691827 n=1 Tax=Anoplophora glabripennis TaxID=217634 RepID=UPI000C764160|nr:uncharacterized protein LOC111691827 [Anoplophora glabripennis]